MNNGHWFFAPSLFSAILLLGEIGGLIDNRQIFSFIRGESARLLDLIDFREENAPPPLVESRFCDILTQPELFMSRSPRFMRYWRPFLRSLSPSSIFIFLSLCLSPSLFILAREEIRPPRALLREKKKKKKKDNGRGFIRVIGCSS